MNCPTTHTVMRLMILELIILGTFIHGMFHPGEISSNGTHHPKDVNLSYKGHIIHGRHCPIKNK
jgi:hypothetical protein